MSEHPNFFPMLVRLAGRKCLVVGAGKIAADKIAGLLMHGAQVTVVSPKAVPRIRELVRKRKITWHRRYFSPADVDHVFLVIAATNSSAINEAVFRSSTARGVLCNAVDDPEHCDFFYPAVVRRGPLQIAISTNGQSPALAARLRRELEEQFGPEWSTWVAQLGKKRREIMGGNKSPKARREELLQIVSRTAFHDFLRGLKPAKSGKATTPRHRRASRERSRGSLRLSTRRAK